MCYRSLSCQLTRALTIAACFTANISLASPNSDNQQHELMDLAREFLISQYNGDGKNIEIRIRPPDRRLQLAACAGGLEPFLPSASPIRGRVTLGIRCLQDTAWQIFLAAEVIERVPVLVSRRPLARGRSLRKEDTEWITLDGTRVPAGRVTNPEAIENKIARTYIPAGRPLLPTMFSEPVVVQRDDAVTVMFSDAGLLVSSRGIALENGAIGEKIKVQNPKSKRIVEGRVNRDGAVEVQ